MKNAAFPVAFLALVFLSGCGPKYTYPASTVSKSVEDICNKEYDIKADARVTGKTLGAVFYSGHLIDKQGQVAKEVHEAMGKVMQAVTRVALSTDLPLDFSTVTIRDRNQGNELTITRSIDDTKRANADAIGVEESINRTLFSQGRYTPSPKGRPVFVLKDVKLENFLSDQIVQRLRFNFSKDAKDSKDSKDSKDTKEKDEASAPFALVDGHFREEAGRKIFRFSMIGLKSEDPKTNILNIFRTVNAVLAGYAFKGFDLIEIQDYLNRQKLVIDRQTLLDFQNKKITETQILQRYLTESQSIQEAFKLFGFTLPSDSTEDAAASAPVVTTP